MFSDLVLNAVPLFPVFYKNLSTGNLYWSATTDSAGQTAAYMMKAYNGILQVIAKSSGTAYAICVTP